MKIAVCLSGHLRTFEQTASNLFSKLIKTNDANVFIHTWNKVGSKGNCDAQIRDKNSNDLIKKIKQHYNPKDMIIEEESDLHDNFVALTGQQPYGSGEMHYSTFKANELQVMSREDYDIVVRARFDQQFLDGLTLKKANYICLPNVGQFGGFNDQFAYGPPELMNKFCDLVKFGNYYVSLGIANAEDFIRKHLDIQQIPAVEVTIPYRLIRANGSVVQFYNGHKMSVIKKDFARNLIHTKRV